MYCSDTQTLTQRTAPKEIAPCFPEQVYATSNGIESGVSTIGFRSGRYAPEEAQESLNRRFAQANLDFDISQQTRHDNRNMMTETEEKSKSDFTNTTEKLRERLKDLHFWKSELEKEILDVIATNDRLIKRKRELERTLEALDECVLLTTDCLNARQRRFGEDLQQDAVELELMKASVSPELDILNKAIALVKRSIQQVNNQLERNRQAKQDLEMAWSDKHEADLLDSEGAHLKPTSTNKQHYAGEARSWPQAAQSTVQSWTQHAHDLILRSEHERMASEQLYQLCESIAIDVARDVVNQKDCVNVAFQKRLDEYECDKQRLIEQLKKASLESLTPWQSKFVPFQLANLRCTKFIEGMHTLPNFEKICTEITELENNIKEMEYAIIAKDAYVKTIQTRLHLHNQRPNVENCRDSPQKAMLDEMHNIQVTIDKLRDQLALTENNLKHLQDTQLMLEKEIHMKNVSIQVDKDHCARHRMAFPSAIRLRGH
ncbi:unnamed protein product [Mesocestoides corti]|uniref:Tektin n=2 Tax=Mesocestoides corti TaxID=53468 RepID=A0A0R3UEG7_MESCO|nr:unnamed protein product [Mesocestoides corti]